MNSPALTSSIHQSASLEWHPDPQPNGPGWQSACGQYAIRHCLYDNNSQPAEFWCYYLVGDRWHGLYPGVYFNLEHAKDRCLEAYKASEAHRHHMECLTWIARGYTTRDKLADLGRRIQARRGRPAAEKLYNGIVAILKDKAQAAPGSS